jgi:hypothetical protein
MGVKVYGRGMFLSASGEQQERCVAWFSVRVRSAWMTLLFNKWLLTCSLFSVYFFLLVSLIRLLPVTVAYVNWKTCIMVILSQPWSLLDNNIFAVRSYQLNIFAYLFIYGLSNDAVSSSDWIISIGRITENNDLKRTWKEAAVAYARVLIRDFSGKTAESK